MTPDTPLTEVAQHLPTEAASYLMQFGSEVQTSVLILMRRVIVVWEEQRLILDPVAYEAVLTMMIVTWADLYRYSGDIIKQNIQLATRNAELTSKLCAVEQTPREAQP